MTPVIAPAPPFDKVASNGFSENIEFRLEPTSAAYSDSDLAALSRWMAMHIATAFTAIASGTPVTFYIRQQDAQRATRLFASLPSLKFEIHPTKANP